MIATRNRYRGMTLIELMVALAIGLFLILGAVTIFLQGRTSFRVNESLARLQENARFALDAIEPDIRMAHYWGLTTRAGRIQGRAAQDEPASPLGPHTCGTNWHLDLDAAVEATNNAYAWDCAAFGTAQPGADTLVIRRASQAPVAPAEGWLQLQSARFQESLIFMGDAAPAGYPPAPLSDTYRLIVNGYYVSQNSTLDTAGNAVPSLRRKTLTTMSGAPAIVDEEVLPGVEDLQIQFGVDTDPVGAANRGSIDRYVNANDPIFDPTSPAFLADAEVLAVRIWLRLRSERIEVGYRDATTYTYADRNQPAFNDGFRRLVMSKTIYLRNARPVT